MAKDDSGFTEIEEYSKKLSHNPESLVFVPLAEAYRKSGMLDEAIDTCLKGLQLHPTYMSARMVLGRAYMEKEMLEEASTEFLKVASADINNIMAHSLLGQIYIKQRKFADAIKEFQKVLSLNPDDGNTQQMLSQALELARQNNGLRPEASAPKEAAPEFEDRDKKQNLSKAEEFSKQGDIENAIKIYQLILEADPENLVVRQRLKDLELRKPQQVNTGKKPVERPKGESLSSLRDNDKITSDDILSVMKDTAPGFSEKSKAESKAVSRPEIIPEAKPPAAAKTEKPPAKSVPVQTEAGTHDRLPSLAKLMQTEGILGSMIIDLPGNILTSTFDAKMNIKEIAVTVALILGKTEKCIQAVDYGKELKQILITGEKGQIIFSKVNNKILLVLADENINLGKMRLAMSEIIKSLR